MLPGVWPRRWMTEMLVAPTTTRSPPRTRLVAGTGSSSASSGWAMTTAPVGLVRRVDQHRGPGLGAAQQVGVVVHRPDRHLGHGQAGKLAGVRRAANG